WETVCLAPVCDQMMQQFWAQLHPCLVSANWKVYQTRN
ncbi:MAG: hypothetical protein ACJAXU_000383, partial [Paracoccaceae bacterium]